MEIDENEIKKAGKYAAAGSAVALFMAMFIHAFVLLALEGLAVAGMYVYNKKIKNSGKKNSGEGKEADATNTVDAEYEEIKEDR